jgi:hypothetical protein
MPCHITYQGDSVELETAEELFVALELTPIDADVEILSQIGEGMLEPWNDSFIPSSLSLHFVA